MVRKSLIIVASLGALVACALALFTAYAVHQAGRSHDIPYPAVGADQSLEGVARGAAIFHAGCEVCHRPTTGERASGAPLADAPAWLGTLHAANITSHPVAGIGALSDAAIARVIRYGVDRHGHWVPMPTYAMSDADLAAVIGYLRSSDPLFQPDPLPTPRSALSLAGKLALAAAGALTPPQRDVSIQAPVRAPSADYGRYLAESVYQCGDCHTAGFESDKTHGPDAYSGGAEAKDAAGQTVYSPNLTPDPETGLGRWTRDQFARAIGDGVRPDGTALGYPMPHFRGADAVDIDALFAHLRSLPAKVQPRGHRALSLATPATAASDPAQQFEALGCVSCHGQGARYEAKLSGANTKQVTDLARWIRNPEQFIPGTSMPTFAAVLDQAAAERLAEWIKQGGAARRSGS